MRIVVAAGLLAFAACRSDGSHAGAGDAGNDDAASPADAYVPTESHALGLNDISMLFQLPENPISGTTVARMSGIPGYFGDLVPRDAFAAVAGSSGQVAQGFDDFHLVAVRFDLCDRQDTAPCADGEDGRLRIVFQPVLSGNSVVTEAADVAVHAFYPIPANELAPLVNELRALARLRDFQTESPLAVNSAIQSTSPPTEYRARLRALLARYAVADRLVRLTLFAQDAQTAPFNWIFRGVERMGGTFQPISIATIGATQQRTILVDNPWPPSYATTPVADVPAGFQLALSTNAYRAATLNDRKAALAALAATQNPTLQGFGTEQCLTCHVATFLIPARASEDNINVAQIANTFMSAHNVSTQFGVAKDNATSLRAFGWFQHYPAISQRVANESAVVLDEIDQRYPPAATTILPDAGVPDAPPAVKRVFVASAQHNGDLKTAGGGTDGLDGADKLCAAAAQAGNLGGQWVAWVSTSTVDAIDRITGNGPWYLVDGTTQVFADKMAILVAPHVAIDRDEFNAQPSGAENVWTGTGSNGRALANQMCVDWTSSTSNTATATGMTGLWSMHDMTWTAYTAGVCSTALMRLYCFEQ